MKGVFTLAVLFCSIAVSSCSEREGWHADRPRGFREYGGSSPGGEGIPTPRDTAIFTLAVEYPAGYDWQRDSAPGSVERRLVLLRGQKRVFEVSACGSDGIRPDPDMNRLWRGQVYSDYNLGGRTVICRNGEELFSYEGREMLMGFAVRSGHVYTLGISREGTGISYRKDGEVILEDPDGVLRDHGTAGMGQDGLLKDEDGQLSFWYEATAGGRQRHYLVVEGVRKEVAIPSNVHKVHEIRSLEDETVMVVSTDGSRNRPVLLWGEKSIQLGRDTFGHTVSVLTGCRIIPTDMGPYVLEGHRLSIGRTLEHCLWDSDGRQLHSFNDLAALLTDGKELALVRVKEDGNLKSWSAAGKVQVPEDEARLIGGRCVSMAHGRFCIAPVPSDRKFRPYIWTGGENLALDLNGYAICTEIYVPGEDDPGPG